MISSRGYKQKYRIKKRQIDIEVEIEVKTPVIDTTTSMPTITVTDSNNPTNTMATPTNQQPSEGTPATTDNPIPFGETPLPEPDNPKFPDTPDTPDTPSDSIPTNIPPSIPTNPPKTPPPDTPKTNSGDNDNNNNDNNNNDNNNNDNNDNNNNNNGNDNGNDNNDDNNNSGDDNGSNNYSSTTMFSSSTIIPSLTSTSVSPTNADGNPATVPPTNTPNPSDKGKISNSPSGPAIIGMIFAIVIALVAIAFIIRKTVYNKDYFRPFIRRQNRRRLLDNEDSENWPSLNTYNNTNDVEVTEGNNNIASSSSMDAIDVLIKPKRTMSRSSSNIIFDDTTNFNSSNTGLLIDYDELSYSSGIRQEERASNRSSLSTNVDVLIPPKIVNWEECMR
jgi:hypothetical protein